MRDVSSSEDSLSLEGHSDLEIREWLNTALSARGFDANALGSPSPYELPTHPIAMGAKYNASCLLPDGLADLSAWFANADLLLSNLQRQMCERSFAASPVRCWPHHFDIATLTTLPARMNGTLGSVNAGLSPGDEYYEGPYFYVSIFPEPDPALLPRLFDLANWHTRDFTAAVLTWDKILESKTPATACLDFMDTAVRASLKLLTS
jgi:hypothetical protein